MFEDVEKNPGQGTSAPDALTPPRPAEDIFSVWKMIPPAEKGGAVQRRDRWKRIIRNSQCVISSLIFLIVAAVGSL
jgi:hypothetical protein